MAIEGPISCSWEVEYGTANISAYHYPIPVFKQPGLRYFLYNMRTL
jgi:hypothetical protein